MPPTFLILLALMAWGAIAGLVWLVAACLFIAPQTRFLGRSLALAMLGTFPGVFLFQIAAAPMAFAIMMGPIVVGWLIEPSHAETTQSLPYIVTIFVAVLIEIALIGGMSLLGFCEGWRLGWQMGKGQKLREAIDGSPTAQRLRSLRNRLGSFCEFRRGDSP